MFKQTLLALALTAGLSTAATAHQDNINVAAGNNVRTASVNVADLNIASADGKAALNARVNKAVAEVCTFGASRFDVDTACAGDAKRDASSQIAAIGSGRLAQSAIVLHGAN